MKGHSEVSTPTLCSNQGSSGSGQYPVRSWNTSKERDPIIDLSTSSSVQPSFVVIFCRLLCNQNYIYWSSLLILFYFCAALGGEGLYLLCIPHHDVAHSKELCLHLPFSVLNRPRTLCAPASTAV